MRDAFAMTDPGSNERDDAEDLELTDEQADSVQGGLTPKDIEITKPVDKPSNP
jgi:hypothetical protein